MNLAPGLAVAERLELESLLGEGGMGAVWAARHRVTGKRVALKVLKGGSPELHRRLIREARVAAAVRHPNLVDVHDVLELDDGTPALVMDLLVGETLASRLARTPAMSTSEVCELMLPVVSAVASAHAAGVVHRDLKPENVFLCQGAPPPQCVKVLDFGIAKLTRALGSMRHTAPDLTQTGSVLGTPTYMAPEQVFGERDIDHRADIWSLGIMIYECLAGRCPTEGENVGQIFKIISQRSFPPLSRVQPGLLPDLTTLIDRMCSLKPHERPQLREIGAVLAAQAGLQCPEIAAPAGAGTSERPTSVATDETLAAPPPIRFRKAKWWMVATTVAVAVAAVGLAWRGAGAEPEARPRADEPPRTRPASMLNPPAEVSPGPLAEQVPSAAAKPAVASAQAATPRHAPPARRRDVQAPSQSAPTTAPTSSTLPGGVHAASPY